MASTLLESHSQWMALRAENIGSTDIAALFGVSKYLTPFELFHLKRGTLKEENRDENLRMKIGKALEPGIAEIVAAEHGLDIRKSEHYYTADDTPGMGCTLDYLVQHHELGEIPNDVKNIDFMVWRDEWAIDKEFEPEPPYDIALQLQHQMACTGAKAACVSALVGGNTPHLVMVPRHEAIIDAIKAKVSLFWLDVREGREPPMQQGDLASLKQLYPEAVDRPDPMALPETFIPLCEALLKAKHEVTDAEQRAELIQQELLHAMGSNKKATVGNWVVTAGDRRYKEKHIPASIQPAKIVRLAPQVKFMGA